MELKLPETDKEYFVLVNHWALRNKAEKLGYDNVILIDDNVLSDEDIDTLKKTGKAVAIIPCPNEPELGDNICHQLNRNDVSCAKAYCMLSDEEELEEEPVLIDTLEKVINHFPTVGFTETNLAARGIIRKTDFEGICGHCNEHLRPEDKYCSHCGTKRGEGEFIPFYDDLRFAYGPPIKVKSKCAECGYTWITGSLGGDRADFCPQCGRKTVKILKEKVLDFGSSIGIKEPFDEDHRPILLSDEQIDVLLKNRDEKAGESVMLINRNVKSIFEEAGIAPEENFGKNLTEFQSEQWSLARDILNLKGTDMYAYKECQCPSCGGIKVAAIDYLYRENDHEQWKRIHNRANGNELVIMYNLGITGEEYDETRQPAYFCLSCGKEFGKLEIKEENME